MAEERKQSERPFHVVTEEGGFHSGYDDLMLCKDAMARLNNEAQSMGLKTRYKAINKP
jgi:hypothetical protein